MPRIFLLSPANCAGLRAQLVMRAQAHFDLARRLRGPHGAELGEVMAFMSGLYFRGKLAYARAFATPPDPACPVSGHGALVITPGAGLKPATAAVTLRQLTAFGRVDIDADNPRYRRPLLAAAREVAARIGPRCDVVLLGSIASDKYVEPLLRVFGEQLKFPPAFVGRGDMSRGGLLLRCAAAGTELEYVPIAGAVRHGERPPKLTPMRWTT
jgi:hypothetical protein